MNDTVSALLLYVFYFVIEHLFYFVYASITSLNEFCDLRNPVTNDAGEENKSTEHQRYLYKII